MYNLQRTIQKENSISGVGLHSGKKCTLKIKPATQGGIVFYRKDLKKKAFYRIITPLPIR